MLRSQFNRVYYTCKPYLPWKLRLRVRRWFAARKRRRLSDEWPILPEAGRAPDGWPGWPNGKRFALVLTHDVEGATGLERCRQLAELESGLGFRSVFNFVPEGDYQTPAPLRQWLGEGGFEIGVHDLNHDGWLYQDREVFRQKAAKINRYVTEWGAVGFRSGFMHHNYDWLHDLEVQYDGSSFDTDPFEPQPDAVRSIFPFWIPNPSPAGPRAGYAEIPYTLAQDSTLFLLFGERTIDVWVRKLRWIAERGGMALINVHPDYIQFRGSNVASRRYPVAFYEEFLRHVQTEYRDQYWLALPRDVGRFVHEHQKVCRNPNFDLWNGAAGPRGLQPAASRTEDRSSRDALLAPRLTPNP